MKILFGILILTAGMITVSLLGQSNQSTTQVTGTNEAAVQRSIELASEPVEEVVVSDEVADTTVGTEEIAQEASGEIQSEENIDVDVAAPVVAGTPGSFSDYSQSKLALANEGTVVLFFHADWCPSCRTLERDINANVSALPENTHILKLDYDTELELRKQYGVVRQHTLIQVDASGNSIKTLAGPTNSLAQVVAQL